MYVRDVGTSKAETTLTVMTSAIAQILVGMPVLKVNTIFWRMLEVFGVTNVDG